MFNTFINANAQNTVVDAEAFDVLVRAKHGDCMEDYNAVPVVVYVDAYEDAVAWYDDENCRGFIA